MDVNVASVVRSAAVAIVGLPIALGVSGTLGSVTEGIRASTADAVSGAPVTVAVNDVRSELTKPCLSYLLSKGDSKLEREAKDEIDSYFGGDVSHGDVCKWVIG
jgi:hypothetical protein